MGPHLAKTVHHVYTTTGHLLVYTPHIQVGNHKIQLRASRAKIAMCTVSVDPLSHGICDRHLCLHVTQTVVLDDPLKLEMTPKYEAS